MGICRKKELVKLASNNGLKSAASVSCLHYVSCQASDEDIGIAQEQLLCILTNLCAALEQSNQSVPPEIPLKVLCCIKFEVHH